MAGEVDDDVATAETISAEAALAGADTVASADAIATAETARSPASGTRPAMTSVAGGPVRDRTWARYVVLEALGEGGMGSVWSAYDPELERKVALKVLHDELLGRANQEQLRREAKAMARVAHPNVVPVFDVGEHAGRTYYTMELVRGRSVRDWASTPRPWREVAHVFVDAARGLAAIHAAGLVHRDIKPGNLLVGDDGRARVADLGIAMSEPDALPDDDATAPLVATTTLRRAGTPAYMAPEQLDGGAGNAASDQFSFGVALWEVLFGAQPFPTSDRAKRRAAMDDGPARGDDGGDAPDWLVAAARRTLAADPAARFPDVAALGRALEGPRPRRWPLAALATAGVAALVVVAATRGGADRPPPVDPCAHAGHELDAWTPARRQALETSVAAHRWPGDPRPASVVGALDTSVTDWRTAARDACRRGASRAWSTELDARGTACLARQRHDLERAAASPDLRVLRDRVVSIVQPSRCLDAAYLAAQLPPAEPVRAAQAEELRSLLDVAQVELTAGHTIAPEGLGMSMQTDNARAQIDVVPRILDVVAPAVDRLGDASVAFQAAALRGDFLRYDLLYDGDEDGVRRQDESAYAAARAADDDADAERGLIRVIDDAASGPDPGEVLPRWLATAHADVARRPEVDAAPLLLDQIGWIELERRETTAAIADAQRALDLAARAYGEHSLNAADQAALLGDALFAADRVREAVPYLERRLADEAAWFGDESIVLTEADCDLARAQSAVGHHTKAIALAQRAVDRFATPVGTGLRASIEEGRANACYGVVLSEAGRDDDAVAPLDHAADVLFGYQVSGGVSSREAFAADAALRRAFLQAHETDRPKLARVLEAERATIANSTGANGADDSDTLDAIAIYAETLAALGRCREAIPLAQPAADAQEHGVHRARAVHALAVVARCRLDGHDVHAADLVLEHADALARDVDPALRARITRLMAEASLARGALEEARANESNRRDQLTAADGDPKTLAAITAWLAAPKGAPP